MKTIDEIQADALRVHEMRGELKLSLATKARVEATNAEREATLRLLRAKMEHYEKGVGAAVGADVRAECRAKVAVLFDVAEIIERGDHLQTDG